MRILLLGANGTLGQRLEEAFRAHTVVVVSQADIDLRQTNKIAPFVIAQQPQLLVNAAAYNDVDGAEADPTLAMQINATAVGELAAAAKQLAVPIVHYSTDYVFDGLAESYVESDVPHPLSAYGRSKAAGEAAVLTSGAEHLLIRTSRLYGEWSDLGVSKPSFVRRMLERSRQSDTIEVVDDEISSPTYARDLAAATLELVDQGQRGIFHRTNDGSCTWLEFARKIFALSGWHGTLVPVPGTRFPRPAKRPSRSVLRTTKLPPLRIWETGLQDHLNRIAKLI